jgi:hypothetical protein
MSNLQNDHSRPLKLTFQTIGLLAMLASRLEK